MKGIVAQKDGASAMNNATPRPLEKELETFRANVQDWLSVNNGKYVVISGTEVLGIFGDYSDALQHGYSKCGLTPFLVKKIEAIETTQRFTRNLRFPCPT